MKALTLIEVLIVNALLVVTVLVTAPVTGRFLVDAQLNESKDLLIQNLRLSGQDSFSGYAATRHGVKFFADSYVMYRGDDYDTRLQAYDRSVALPGSLRLSWSLDEADEIGYDTLGRPRVVGTVSLNHDSGLIKSFQINELGVINQL